MFNVNTALRTVMLIVVVNQISTHPVIEQHPDNLQSLSATSGTIRSMPDVAATIDQVHKILEDDPTLPRLTRGEIKELFEQVTKEEYEKSLRLGDMSRANNMRALMLVLPYNINNTTEDDLQELYTRPPITKVIDSYTIPHPQKFQKPASIPSAKVEVVEVGNLVATTYKPSFRMKEKNSPNPTTYHPAPPIFKAQQMSTTQLSAQVPVTSLPLLPDIEEEQNKATRYSSSYSAKDTDWFHLEGELNRKNLPNPKFTPMPDLSGMLKSMGMDMQTQSTKQFKLEDYYQAAKPVISSTIKQKDHYQGSFDVADFSRTLPPRPVSGAYFQFKPLNIGEEIRVQPEVEHYLNRFGIVNRKRKQIKPEDKSEAAAKEESSTNSENIELAEAIKIDLPVTTVNQSTKPKEQSIKRIDTNVDDDSDSNNLKDHADLAQLKKLLNNLQELERLNVSLTADMLKSVDLGNFNLSSGIRAQGPDPLINVADSRKNDIKRQSTSESNSNPTKFNLDLDLNAGESDTTSTSTTEEPSSTTEEPRNGSLADLEDSFGGPDPVTEDPDPPPPKQNGFYFLADWNSFLEVGEAGKDQVVVRFDPKIGDARRFLKVTVP